MEIVDTYGKSHFFRISSFTKHFVIIYYTSKIKRASK